MGAQLVTVALAKWAPHISDRAFRVLVRMAVTALDNDNGEQAAGMYFGGDELLAMTLQARTESSARRQVRYGIAELVDVGAIECVQKGHRGRRAVYRLTLESDGERVNTRSAIAEHTFTLSGQKGEPTFRKSMNTHSPLGTKGGTTTDQERQEEEGVTYATGVQTAREPDPLESNLHQLESTADTCGGCGTYLDPDGACFTCGPRHHRKDVA